ncbi:MAG: type II secretion system protein [Candidatus Doudnabacteria bacterium]|nr:type II secretion system protein [Candidatus Doudnabacteria bacterium]
MRKNPGQTLIETIIAIFVLATGLSAGLALAIFAFGASADVTEKIAATGLAREGIEVVRRMRDSNWLAGNLTVGEDCGTNQACYSAWLNQTYNIRGAVGTGISYIVDFDPAVTVGNKWSITQADSSTNFRLYQTTSGNPGLTHQSSSLPTSFFRKVEISYAQTTSPYTATSPLVLVRSIVWWHGKRCNNSLTNLTNPQQTACKIITEEYLANWRNY